MLIRPALPVDQEAIATIHTASWRATYRHFLPETALGPALEAQHGAFWEAIFATPQPGRVVLVAQGEAVAGFILSEPDAADPGLDYIAALHVDPAARGGGLGTTLMREWSDRMVGIGRRRASLIVDEGNTRAREFYAKLGGQEGERFLDSLAGYDPTPVRRVVWQDIAEIGWRARGEAIAKLAPPLSLTARELPAWSGAAHPVAAAKAAAARRKQPLGDPFGLTDYGVNRVEIAPGTRSTVQHYHSHEDEWVMVLEGALTLISEDRERVLHPGDCAGFPAGTGPAHLLENRGTAPAIYLEIGSRRPDRDITRYPDEDLMVAPGPDGAPWFQRRDGTPLGRAP